MPTLQAEDILDITRTTLRDLGRAKFTQIATRRPRYEVFDRIMKKERVQWFDDGFGIQWDVMVDHSGAAEMTGLFHVSAPNIGNVMQQATVPWRQAQTYYGWEHREVLYNRGPSRIVDLIKVRRGDGMISLIELLEDEFWQKPVDSTDKLHMFGVPYWVVKNATEGFNGGNPAGFAAGAGNISSLVYTRWANWTNSYAQVSKTDLILKMRSAALETDFKAPIDIEDFRTGTGQNNRIYTNRSVWLALNSQAEDQNDRLGPDIASMDGETVFQKRPIVYVPKLNEDAQNPVYMLNWSYMGFAILRGDYLRESKPAVVSEGTQHNTYIVWIDLSGNPICRDRRRQAVLHYVAA